MRRRPPAPANDATPFRPRSPYDAAKATAFWEVANYREAYDLFSLLRELIQSGIGPRPPLFVTRKVLRAACCTAAGSTERLSVGETRVVRDWGYASEYVRAM